METIFFKICNNNYISIIFATDIPFPEIVKRKQNSFVHFCKMLYTYVQWKCRPRCPFFFLFHNDVLNNIARVSNFFLCINAGRRRSSSTQAPGCPVCGTSIRPGEMESHFAWEMERFCDENR